MQQKSQHENGNITFYGTETPYNITLVPIDRSNMCWEIPVCQVLTNVTHCGILEKGNQYFERNGYLRCSQAKDDINIFNGTIS